MMHTMRAVLSGQHYSNIKMLSPEGVVMCRLSERRANWYLDRGLAKLEADNAIRLNFTPNGLGAGEGTRQAQSWFDKASNAVNNPTPANPPVSGQTPAVPAQSVDNSTAPQAQEQAYAAQQINMLKSQLSAFANEMYRRYTAHKKRASDMENQYNMSKANYAKVRGEFFNLQTEIGNLNSSLSDWNERLSEYYAPAGGE